MKIKTVGKKIGVFPDENGVAREVDRLSLNDMTIGDLKLVVAAIAENYYKQTRIFKIVDFVMWSLFFVLGSTVCAVIIYDMFFI